MTETLHCRCGGEARIVRLNDRMLALGHVRNPKDGHHAVRLSRSSAASRGDGDERTPEVPEPGGLAIAQPEVRASAVGSRRYPDPTTSGTSPQIGDRAETWAFASDLAPDSASAGARSGATPDRRSRKRAGSALPSVPVTPSSLQGRRRARTPLRSEPASVSVAASSPLGARRP